MQLNDVYNVRVVAEAFVAFKVHNARIDEEIEIDVKDFVEVHAEPEGTVITICSYEGDGYHPEYDTINVEESVGEIEERYKTALDYYNRILATCNTENVVKKLETNTLV